MSRPYELLIFDWDGTLSDSASHIVSNMQAAITALGLPPRADQQISELIGLGIADGMRRLYPEIATATLLEMLMSHRGKAAPSKVYEAALFHRADAALLALRDAGYRLAVATGKPRLGLDRSLLFHSHLEPLFELTRCADETADKPDPKMLHEILQTSGVSAERALMIGDTEYDVAMARSIGMQALGVACGVHDAGRLLKAGARAVVDDVAAIPAWLASLPELVLDA